MQVVYGEVYEESNSKIGLPYLQLPGSMGRQMVVIDRQGPDAGKGMHVWGFFKVRGKDFHEHPGFQITIFGRKWDLAKTKASGEQGEGSVQANPQRERFTSHND